MIDVVEHFIKDALLPHGNSEYTIVVLVFLDLGKAFGNRLLVTKIEYNSIRD